MRIVTFIILACTLVMCKSKNVIPEAQLLNYVVVLEGEKTPKALKKDISSDLVSFEKTDKTANQWTLKYNEDISKEKKLKSELLNHPIVISAFTMDQYKKILLKKGQQESVGSQGKRKATKQ